MEVIGFSIKVDSLLKLGDGLGVRVKEKDVRPVGALAFHKTKMNRIGE